MSESGNVCLSCGLCCDGTIIGFVQLDGDELSALKELMDIEESSNKGVFLQPCNNYCDGCNIYSQRPKQCASFKCRLLKSVEKKELDFDSAIDVISLVKQKKSAIEKQLTTLPFKLKSQSFYFKMVELKNLLTINNIDSSMSHNHGDLMSDLMQLDKLLSKNFGVSLS